MSQQSQQPQSPQVLALPGLGALDEEEEESLAAPGPPWWRRRGTIIAICIFLLIVLLGAFLLFRMARRPRITYQTQQVTQGNLSLTVSATGPLQGGVYNISFSGTGKISEIDVSVGQKVTEGQVLARLDKTSLQDALDQAQASYDAALTMLGNGNNSSSATQGNSSASISSAATALSNARANLMKVQAQSQAGIDAAQTALNSAQINYNNVKAQSAANIKVAEIQKDQACAPPPPTPTPTTGPSCDLATAQYKQAVANATANNDTAEAQVDTDENALATAQAQAAANNTAAQNQVNTAQAQLNSAIAQAGLSNTTAQGQVNTAVSQLNTAFVQLQTAQHNLDNATLTAPHNGTVTVINGTVGGTPGISASSTSTAASGGTFIQIVDTSALQVVANVNETDTANLKVGDPAQFTVSAYGNQQFVGTVSAISPNGQTVSNVVTYPVTIDVDMSKLHGANLLPGMTANVTITVLQRSNVLLVPVDAVNFARLASTGNATTGVPQLLTAQQVTDAMRQARQMFFALESQNPDIANESPVPAFVLESSGSQFIAKPVVLGLSDGTVYEVLAGLNAGESVIVGTSSRSSGTTPTTPSSGGPGGGGPFRGPGGG